MRDIPLVNIPFIIGDVQRSADRSRACKKLMLARNPDSKAYNIMRACHKNTPQPQRRGPTQTGNTMQEDARTEPNSPASQWIRYVYLLSHKRPELFCEDLVRAHVAHLKKLDERGQLELCGPFPNHDGGMVILREVNETKARAIAESDPFVRSGAESYELRAWELSCRENNHLGMG